MTIKPVADLYLIKYEDGRLYKCTRDAEEAVDAIGFGFEVEEFVSLEKHRAAMLQGAENAESRCSNSPVIPDGWVMVPVEPTPEMINSAMRDNETGEVAEIYELMLAAAPQREGK